uniref:hypothetical protein n=1 Tax=Fulvivirga sp. TaxID=1931237 RepID=UPI0040494807
MNTKSQEDKHQHDWAKNQEGKPVHINNSPSGAKGYYCMGCGNEMVAIQRHIEGYRPYFRHHVKDQKIQLECTFNSETYRHKVAKEILQRIKRVKVPKVIKKPPVQDGISQAILLKDEEIIRAHTVKNELQFYEDEEGMLQWNKKLGIEDKNLIIKPDVTFFDKSGNPILLIELVATHKASSEKLSKIKALGINAIEIILPRGDSEEIEAIFSITKNTKWLFNKQEYESDYFQLSRSSGKTIFQAESDQEFLYEETFECRRTEIGNLIRAIGKVVSGPPYEKIEANIREEIQRVSRIKKSSEQQWEELRGRIEDRVFDAFAEESRKIRTLTDDTQKQDSKVEERYRDLEERYQRKAGELRLAEDDFSGDIRPKNRIHKDREEEIEQEQIGVNESLEFERREIERIQRETDDLPRQFAELEKSTIREIESLEKGEKDIIEETRRIEAELPREFEEAEREARQIFESRRKEVIRCIEEFDSGGVENFTDSSRFIKLLRAREFLLNFESRKSDYQRVRAAKDLFASGAYKSRN